MAILDFLKPPKITSKELARKLPIGTFHTESRMREAQRLLEARFGFSPEQMLKIGYFKQQNVRKWTDGAYNLSTQLVSLWSQAVTSRRDYIMVSSELRKFYLVDRLLELITQDVLNADENGDIVKLVPAEGREDLGFELELFQENCNLNLILQEITQDFIDFGEYALRMDIEEGRGLYKWSDDVDPLNLVAFYEGGYPSNYLVYKDKDFQMLPAHHYAHFIMGNNKLRVRMEDQLTSGFGLTNEPDLPDGVREKLPDYIRVGKPLFLGVISKLRELQLLEMLIPASKLNQITQSQMVSLHLPASMPPDQVQAALEHYEEILNIPTGLDFTRNQISLAEIMTAAGKIRAVPNFSDGKGALETMNIRANQSVDDIISSIRDIRAIILASLVIPPSLLFGGSGDEAEKFNELKLHSQYARRLASIQRALSKGLEQMVLAHLVNKGIQVKPKDFNVVFTTALIDISGLERLEFQDAEQALLGNMLDFVEKMSANPILMERLDKSGIADWMEEQFSSIAAGHNLFLERPDRQKIRNKVKKVAQKISDIVQAATDIKDDKDTEQKLGGPQVTGASDSPTSTPMSMTTPTAS
jgi:hypothetical protein